MAEKGVQRPTQGRPRQSVVLRKATADAALRKAETDQLLAMPVTTVLKPNKPGTVANAPYTMGAKRTKVKMNWFQDADGCYIASVPDTVALESRGYESRREPWKFRIRGNALVYENDKKNRTFAVLQCVERAGYIALEWLIDPGDQPEIYEHALDFLGLDFSNPKSFGAIAAERRSLFKCLTACEREKLRKAARKMHKKPGKAERIAARNALNKAGLPKQSFRLV